MSKYIKIRGRHMDALLNGIYIYGITVIMMIIIAYNMSKK